MAGEAGFFGRSQSKFFGVESQPALQAPVWKKSQEEERAAAEAKELALWVCQNRKWYAREKPPEAVYDGTGKRRKKTQSQMDETQKLLVSALFKGVYVERFENLVGYTVPELRRHIERQFTKGMKWKNHASSQLPPMASGSSRKRTWHVDHIVPKSKFAIADIEAAFALTNLRPLWEKDNLKKGASRTHLV